MASIFGMDGERTVEREVMNIWPSKITGANAGEPRPLPVRKRWAARVA